MKLKLLTFFVLFLFLFTTKLWAQSMESVLIVSLDIQPETATIIIDGKGVTPKNGTVELVKGKHELLIQNYGYYAAHEMIKVNRKKAYFHFELQRDLSVNLPPNKDSDMDEDTIITPVALSDSVVESMESREKIVEEVTPYKFNMPMVELKAGVFLMGQKGRDNSEFLHEVKVKDFSIGKYEVTQAQWNSIMDDNPSKFKGDSLPVENVSWDEVQVFIRKLNEQTAMKYRLPTEAEWEYAARKGNNDGTAVFSNMELADYAWYWRNSGDSLLMRHWDNEKIKKNHCRTHKIGQRKPNKIGMYDAYGNVWEWCSDWYASDYYRESNFENPIGPSQGVARVFRGGGWLSKISNCRSGYRFFGKPSVGYSYLGFRLVLDQ